MMKNDNKRLMTDAELDRLLSQSSHPVHPLGAEGRLMKRLAVPAPIPSAPVLSGPVRPTRSSAWWMAAPLAASLILGLYLGGSGLNLPLLQSEDNATLSAIETEDIFGLDDAELLAAEDLT